MLINLARLSRRWIAPLCGLFGLMAIGCQSTAIDLSEGPAPLRTPRPNGDAESYEDSLTGGEVFSMYCNQCHNARALGERPFANYQNVAAHMRVRANLTGKEYEKLIEFLRRWHDVPAPTPPNEPSPKRLIFSQPISELRDEPATGLPAAPAQPAPAQGQPVQGQPAQGQPVQGQPVQGQPVQGQPVQGQPVQGQPAQGQPAQGQPAQGLPSPVSPPQPALPEAIPAR